MKIKIYLTFIMIFCSAVYAEQSVNNAVPSENCLNFAVQTVLLDERQAIITAQTSSNTEVSKTYPLSGLRKISNKIRAKDEITLKGIVQSTTYQIENHHDLLTTINELRRKLDSTYVLMWCENRECGSSPWWANYIFNNPQLNGLDDAQSYLLIDYHNPASNKPEDRIYAAIYAVTRGNQKSYIHIETLNATNQKHAELTFNAETLLKILKKDKKFELFNLDRTIDITDMNQGNLKWFELIRDILKLDVTLKIRISGEQVMAKIWQDKIKELNMPAKRIELNFNAKNSSKRWHDIIEIIN